MAIEKRYQLNGSDRRVLIVDDDRDFADSLAEILELRGYQVTTLHKAKSGKDCLKKRPLPNLT